MLVLNSIFTKEDVNQINEYTNYIRKQERERIIKLLEEAQITTAEIFSPVTCELQEIKVHSQSVRADLLIALIKGEQSKSVQRRLAIENSNVHTTVDNTIEE